MTDLAEQLAQGAAAEGVSFASAFHLHLLQGVVRRWARSRHRDRLVLGGGLLTQQWVGLSRRFTNDLDFVGLYPHDLGESLDLFHEVLSADVGDGIVFDLDTLHGQITWGDTDFPGTRTGFEARLLGQACQLWIDVGFNYPLVPPAWQMEYPSLIGDSVTVPALAPELLAAWKFDGLFKHGRHRWLPKALLDVYLLTRYLDLDQEKLIEGIRVAFDSKVIPVERVLEMTYTRAWWIRESAQNRWAKYRATANHPVPESLLFVAGSVARALRPALSHLISFPEDEVWMGDEQEIASEPA